MSAGSTNPNDDQRHKDAVEKSDDEHHDSLSEADRSNKQSLFSRAYLLGPVKKDHADLALLACCFVTGMVDSASFSNWGVFVGMQTGNTVILGLSTSGLPSNPHGWLTTLVSLGSFLTGAFTTFRLSNFFAPENPYSHRVVMASLFFIQGLLILVAAALATVPHLIPQNPGSTSRTTLDPPSVIRNVRIVTLVPLLAFQSGMQIASSRLLQINELPVNVLTSTYCDLMGNYQLFALNSVKRNRQVSAIVLVLCGAISSGWLMRSPGGLESVLWIAGGIKFFVAVATICFMPAMAAIQKIDGRV